MRITGSVGQIGCAGQLQQLSQEVRAAATTTGTVAALREQVGAGEYQVDPHAIARSLLFVWEA